MTGAAFSYNKSMKMRFKKKLMAIAVAFFLFIGMTAGLVLFVAVGGQGYARVSFSKSYYFLVKDCEETTATAVSGDIYSAGGAGYLLEKDNAVAIACYFKESSAESVRKNLEEKGTETRLVVRSPKELILRGSKSAYKAQIEGNLETVDSIAHILYDTANGLERSELSQNAAKAALSGVVSSLKGLIESNAGNIFALWNAGLKEAERKGSEIGGGILFAKDLRYLQTMLCDKSVNLTNYFI